MAKHHGTSVDHIRTSAFDESLAPDKMLGPALVDDARQMPSTQTLRAILPRSARDLAGFQLSELSLHVAIHTRFIGVFQRGKWKSTGKEGKRMGRYGKTN